VLDRGGSGNGFLGGAYLAFRSSMVMIEGKGGGCRSINPLRQRGRLVSKGLRIRLGTCRRRRPDVESEGVTEAQITGIKISPSATAPKYRLRQVREPGAMICKNHNPGRPGYNTYFWVKGLPSAPHIDADPNDRHITASNASKNPINQAARRLPLATQLLL